VGVGVTLKIENQQVFVVQTIPNSPAQKAGILKGDEIVSLDGNTISGMLLGDILSAIKGTKGSTIEFGILRKKKVLRIVCERDSLQIPQDFAIRMNGEILEITLRQFGTTTLLEFRNSIEESLQQLMPKGVILDLRDNPGGLLSSMNTVACVFLPRNTTLTQIQTVHSVQFEYTEKNQLIPKEIPIVVILNENTAGAGELIASLLHDKRGAALIGQKSAGVTRVENSFNVAEGVFVRLFIATMFKPNGESFASIGLQPDIVINSGLDTEDVQLKAARNYLKQSFLN
jgi:carboxyl-terminal processing protease